MAPLDRLKGILFDPRTEWPKIAAEPATTQSIYTGWVMILAAIGPLAMLTALGGLGLGVRVAVLAYLNALVGTAVLALIVDLLASSFGGTKDFVASLKLVAYSLTVVWVAQVMLIVPLLGMLILLVAAIYACYTFFVGAAVLNKCAPDKAIPYTIVVLLCAIVLSYIFRLTAGGIGYSAATALSGMGMLR
jgi:hypothetical protein